MEDELNSLEFLFLKKMDSLMGLLKANGIEIETAFDIIRKFDSKFYWEISNRAIIHQLEGKDIINLSPDGTKFKLTNYGNQLFSNKIKEEQEWVNQGPFIKLNPEKKEEIDIKQGEHFKGYWEVVNILKRAKRTVKIQDAYIGVDTIAILNELDESVDIQILTSDKNFKHKDLAFTSFSKFQKQRKGKTEIKINNGIHSRRIIVDDLEVYSCDDSLKDIGLHNASKIKKLINTEEELDNYKVAWSKAVAPI